MKKRIARWGAAALAAGLLVTGGALALSQDDSLVSLSYLNKTYVPEVVSQGDAVMEEKLTMAYEGALGQLGQTDTLGGLLSYSGSFQTMTFTRGDQIALTTGSGFLMQEGQAVWSHNGAVVDVTLGQTVSSGSALVSGHRYLVGEDTSAQVTVRSGLARGGVQGAYTWTRSGESAAPFVDVSSGDWYCTAVDFAYFNELFAGMGDDQFAPQSSMNRAMMMTVLYHLAGSPEAERLAATASFTDVPAGQWYTTFIAWAAEKGVSAGTGGGKFSPDEPVTRQQVVVLLHNFAMNYMGLTLEERQDITVCADYGQVASWAQDAMSWAAACGVVSAGSGVQLEPERSATRAEVAFMLMSFSQMYLE